MILIGLTGGIASGKSLVAKYLQENGITVIDSDLIARKVVLPNKPAWNAIKAEFGCSVIKNNGLLDRYALASIIFSDPLKRHKLNSIIHPYIQMEMIRQIILRFLRFEKFIILDLPLLFEVSGIRKYLTKIIVVHCDKELQIDRLMKRDNLTKEQALDRINSQMSLEEKVALADFVIFNSGSIEETKHQIDKILDELNHSSMYLKYRIVIWSVAISLSSTFSYSLYRLVKWMFFT